MILEKKDAKKTYLVASETTLMSFLAEIQPNKSRNKIKSQLTHRQVSVNNIVTTQYNTELKPGDKIEIIRGIANAEFKHPMMRIVYEDDYIIVIDKRNGLLSVGTDKEHSKTAFFLLSEHIKLADPQNRLFVIHRLDRETSGLMMYAKSEEVQSKMQREWHEMVTDRRYVAVVEGTLEPDKGVIDAPLTENKNLKMYVNPEGERAVTGYEVLERGKEFSLVELTLETGKKNQIRAHLEYKKCPIAGDKKYNAVTNPAGRVCLHAHILNFVHPVSGEQMNFSTPVPTLFEAITKKGSKFVRRSPELRPRRRK